MSSIELVGINKEFGKKENRFSAVNNINIEIQKGEMLAIIGPSGSGKSTILNIIGTLITPTSGQYLLNGQDIFKLTENELSYIRNKNFGFILQYFALIDDYKVKENILLPTKYNKTNDSKVVKRLENIVKILNIQDKLNSYPNELSGGQQQRVAIARALINNPDYILADEPTGALDQKTGKEIIDYLDMLNKRENKTVIIVTHDMNIANRCSRIINIQDGKII